MPPDARVRLVIFGEQRSGTTLLARLLDAQPGVRVFSGYLSAMMYCAYRELGLTPRAELTPRQRHVLWQRVRVNERDSALRLEAAMPEGVQTLDALHAHLLQRIAGADDRIVGHKIHGPIEALPKLLETSDVRCIYLIRDARDVLLSRSYRGQSAFDEVAKTWLTGSRMASALKDHPRMLVIRFEDLIMSSASTLQRLADWLGLAGVDAGALVGEDDRPRLQNSSHGELQKAFDPSAVGRYRAFGDSRLMRFAQWRCGEELERWGYSLDARLQPSLRERAHFARRVLTVEALELPRLVKNALLARALPSLVADE